MCARDRRQFGDMVLHDPQPLLEVLGPTPYIAGSLTIAYFALVAVVACVSTFAPRKLSKQALRVLKVLTRWKHGPPGPGPL
jgi:hypothetical protein